MYELIAVSQDSNSQPENIGDSACTEVDMTLCNIEQYAEPQLAPVEDRSVNSSFKDVGA